VIYFEDMERERFGHTIDHTGVYQALDGKWYAYHISPGGGSGSVGYDTALEARRELLSTLFAFDRMDWEWWTWMQSGDCAPRDVLTTHQQMVVGGVPKRLAGPRNVLRIDGHHYIPRCIDQKSTSPFKGFGGRTFRWRWLDEPEDVVHFSNDVMTQGVIPEKMRHLLTDNAVWVTSERGA
jgi:hypothetical protein